MRRGSILQLVLIGLIAGAIATVVAVAVPWLPDPASKQAERIDFVYWFATVISLVIFAVVCAVMIYAMINFRAKPGDWSDGPPVHGNTTIEIIWTIIPAILVTAISIVSAIVLAQNGHAGTNPLIVKVQGEQFAWQFTYPNGKTYPILRLPIDRGVRLEITSRDVHPFVLGAGVRAEAGRRPRPGQHARDHAQPPRPLPGHLHRALRPRALVDAQLVVRPDEGRLREVVQASSPVTAPSPTGGAGVSAGALIFTSNGCSACHTFTPIPAATGKVGPDLDDLTAAAKKAGQPLEDYIRQSIIDPNAYITPGYQPGVMPTTYNHTIVPHTNIEVLAQIW